MKILQTIAMRIPFINKICTIFSSDFISSHETIIILKVLISSH